MLGFLHDIGMIIQFGLVLFVVCGTIYVLKWVGSAFEKKKKDWNER